jgi:hypothetical protein
VTKPPTQNYGKASGPLLSIKQDFFTKNDEMLAEQLRLGQVYTAQDFRTDCKCCGQPIEGVDFVKQGIGYILCPTCSHLNGAHDDSAAFCAAVYTDDSGKQYATHYEASDKVAYDDRVRDIYVPKAEFLLGALEKDGQNPLELAYADFGAGSGYFISALMNQGAKHAAGFEVSQAQVDLARAVNSNVEMTRHDLDETAPLASSTRADVVSLIGVLEHLQRPREFLQAVSQNTAVTYLFLSVPLFSPCVFLEMVFPKIMQRQLTGGHTHLFTEASLDWMRDEFGFEKTAEWWFGTDMVDLFRMVQVSMEKSTDTKGMTENWVGAFGPVIDALQLELDKRHLSSEVHQLWRIRR